MAGMLAPVMREKPMGKAEVRQVFTIPKAGTIAGTFVTEGRSPATRSCGWCATRCHLHGQGRVAAPLQGRRQRGRAGLRVRPVIEGYSDIKVGDIIEAFEIEKLAATLENPTGEGNKRN